MGRRTEEEVTEKPFLKRWAGRKAAARKEQPEVEPPAAAPADNAESDAPPRPRQAAPITEEELAALPPVETLGAGSDIKDFLRPGVPVALKNAAMRKMWLLTPAIRDHKDVAVDYAWDWNTPGGVPGDGGRLDPTKAAQWARQIAGLEERPPKKPRSPGPKADAAATPDAPRETAEAGGDDAAKEEEAKRRDPPGAPSPPAARPRHGGARPE